jgi:hypothetical protein
MFITHFIWWMTTQQCIFFPSCLHHVSVIPVWHLTFHCLLFIFYLSKFRWTVWLPLLTIFLNFLKIPTHTRNSRLPVEGSYTLYLDGLDPCFTRNKDDSIINVHEVDGCESCWITSEAITTVPPPPPPPPPICRDMRILLVVVAYYLFSSQIIDQLNLNLISLLNIVV